MDNWTTNSISECQKCKTEFDGCSRYCDKCKELNKCKSGNHILEIKDKDKDKD